MLSSVPTCRVFSLVCVFVGASLLLYGMQHLGPFPPHSSIADKNHEAESANNIYARLRSNVPNTTICHCTGGGNCLLENVQMSSLYALSTSTRCADAKKLTTVGQGWDYRDSPYASVTYRPFLASTAYPEGSLYRAGVHIYKEPYYIDAVGHVLGDDIFTMFSLMYDFNIHMLPPDNTTVILPRKVRDNVQGRAIILEHYNLITTRPIVYVDGGSSDVYEYMLVGWEGYGYSFGSRIPPTDNKVGEFRRRAMTLYHLKEIPQYTCSVLLIIKDMASADHKYGFSNADELVNGVRNKTHCSIERVTWLGMTLASQVALIHDKTIVVSLPGTDIMNCLFQPPRSGMIIPDQCNERGCSGSNEVRLLFSLFPSRYVYTVPVNNSGMSWNRNILTWNLDHLVESVLRMDKLLNDPSLLFSDFFPDSQYSLSPGSQLYAT